MTNRDHYVRNAARYLVSAVNADQLQTADCTIDAILASLDAPFFANLSLSTQYSIGSLSDSQRRALAKAIASAFVNHPDLDKAKVARIEYPK